MKDLREFSDYLIDISEGIFADMEDTLTAGDNYVDNELIKSWFVDDHCKIFKTKQGYVLHGNFKMKDIGEHYEGPKIKNVKGNVAISNTKLETLEGIFNVDCEITGSLTIEDNDNLTSLKGCPLIVKGSLTIAGNKKLKDIDYAPTVYINAYISHNGKKFKKDELAKKLQVYKHIFCSLDEEMPITEGEMIYEAFKAPQLKVIADAIRDASKGQDDRNRRFRFSDISYSVEWDKIDASRITEYETSDSKCATIARKYIAGSNPGFMALMDSDGDVYGLVSGKRFLRLKNRHGGWRGDQVLSKYSNRDELNSTEMLDLVLRADTVMFINLSGYNHNNYYQKRADRNNAQSGALAFKRGEERSGKDDSYFNKIDVKNIRYYQKVADDNRERYKRELTKLKAQRAAMSNNFSQIKVRLDRAFDRYTTLLTKILQNPSKYDGWDFGYLNDKFARVYQPDRYNVQERGLFQSIEIYIKYMIDASKGSVYNNKNIQATMQQVEARIIADLDQVETELTKLERI